MPRALASLGQVMRNPDLRRLEAGFAAFQGAEYGVWIAMLVYAFDRGGTTTAAVVAVVQLVPSALFAPVGGALADRYAAAWVLTAGFAAQGLALGATGGALLLDAPPAVAYGLSAVAATALTVTRPTQAVLAPALARTPNELTAANVVTAWIETAMALAAPALTGVLLTVGSAGLVFIVFAAAAAWSAVLLAPIAARTTSRVADAAVAEGALAALTGGFRALARHPHPRVLVELLALAYVVWGALDVLSVVLAVDVLGLGDGGVGYLNAAFGAGGVLGAAVAVALVGRRRLVPPILTASLVWGGTFALLGVSSSTVAALVLLTAGGAGQSLMDTAGRTLLQRISPPETLARIFGVHEGLTMAALAVGSIIVPALVAVGGASLAFAVVGAVLPLGALFLLRRLLAVDSAARVPIVEISLLRSLRIFRALPPPALEGIAHNLEPLEVPEGAVICREGDVGDRYYTIADGEVEAVVGSDSTRRLSRGDGFGEIALLRDVPRTTTVRAVRDTRLYALDRESFLVALTGHAPTAAAAESIMVERLGAAV